MALLEVQDLGVEFGAFRAVDNVTLHVDAGEVLGIVGESGSGKSVTALALMGLIDEPGRVHAQRLMFDGRDLLAMPVKERRGLGVSRPGRAAADAGMGLDAGERARVHPERVVGRHLAGAGDPGLGAGLQSDGRRAARCARPAA